MLKISICFPKEHDLFLKVLSQRFLFFETQRHEGTKTQRKQISMKLKCCAIKKIFEFSIKEPLLKPQ